MIKIATLIDRLPPPQFPTHLSDQDRQMLLLALASAKQQIRPYDGKFEAPWLLTPFTAQAWETTNRGREELVNGQWKNTCRQDWRVTLPNGALLTDARYETLLALVKKIAFLSRSGLVIGAIAPLTWKHTVRTTIGVARWTVLHEERFLPEKYGLRLLDQPALDWLFGQIAKGGWTHALQIPQRILAAMYLGTHSNACPQSLLEDPYSIPTA